MSSHAITRLHHESARALRDTVQFESLAERWVGVLRRRRRARDVSAELPELVDMLGRSLRSGSTLRGSLAEALDGGSSAMANEIRPVVEALARGQRSHEALHEWATRSTVPSVRMVSAALSLAAEHEAGSTQALDGVGQTVRDQIALTNEISALTSQAVVSMRALVLLPIAFLAIDLAGGQTLATYLLHQRLGRFCLISGGLLNLVGWVWMRSLVRRQLPR